MPGQRLKIIYVLAASYARGGIKMLIEHANRLSGLGHEVEIISASEEPDWIELQVPWTTVTIPDGQPLGHRIPACDLVVFSYYEQAYALLESALQVGAVPVYFAQGDELLFGDAGEAGDLRVRQQITAAQASVRLPYPILTVSSAAAAKIRSFGGKDITVIPNGIDLNLFYPRPKGKNPILKILAVGAEFPKFKGIMELYAALIKLKQDLGQDSFRFVRLSPAANSLGELPMAVEFIEKPDQETLARTYSEADIFVGPSHNESFYLPPLEAMASSTAVVCSDLPAVRDYAVPGRDYLPFEPGNVAQMYHQIKKLLQNEPLRRQLAESGLATAEKMAWEAIIPRVEAYLIAQLERRDEILLALTKEKKKPSVPFSFRKKES